MLPIVEVNWLVYILLNSIDSYPTWMEPWLDLGAMAPQMFFLNTLLYICVLILAILFYKIIFCLLNNIIDSFKSIVISTNFSTTFLKTVKVANSYWLTFEPTIYIIFLLTNNHLRHQQFVKKKKIVALAFSSF